LSSTTTIIKKEITINGKGEAKNRTIALIYVGKGWHKDLYQRLSCIKVEEHSVNEWRDV